MKLTFLSHSLSLSTALACFHLFINISIITIIIWYVWDIKLTVAMVEAAIASAIVLFYGFWLIIKFNKVFFLNFAIVKLRQINFRRVIFCGFARNANYFNLLKLKLAQISLLCRTTNWNRWSLFFALQTCHRENYSHNGVAIAAAATTTTNANVNNGTTNILKLQASSLAR